MCTSKTDERVQWKVREREKSAPLVPPSKPYFTPDKGTYFQEKPTLDKNLCQITYKINITIARQIRVSASAIEYRNAPIESLASALTPKHTGLVYQMSNK